MKIISVFLFFCLFFLSFCTTKTRESQQQGLQQQQDTSAIGQQKTADAIPEKVEIEKELLYDQHTLTETYPYKDTTRVFQWDKVEKHLSQLEAMQKNPARWVILQNYKNKNGEAPLVKTYQRNAYKRIADTLGVERYQSIPLYLLHDSSAPELYGRDGALVKILDDKNNLLKIETIYTKGEWLVPKKYLKPIPDTVNFKKAIFVDRTNQNIATLEHIDSKWLIRSMNPATTGLHKPPYAQETPLGMFVLQEKKAKMIFLVDGSQETGGFAPFASRFTNGGYIHGIPVNAPRKSLIEFSPSLGTTPRSHMCVRNATSHAQFIYDWAPTEETIIFVLE